MYPGAPPASGVGGGLLAAFASLHRPFASLKKAPLAPASAPALAALTSVKPSTESSLRISCSPPVWSTGWNCPVLPLFHAKFW